MGDGLPDRNAMDHDVQEGSHHEPQNEGHAGGDTGREFDRHCIDGRAATCGRPPPLCSCNTCSRDLPTPEAIYLKSRRAKIIEPRVRVATVYPIA